MICNLIFYREENAYCNGRRSTKSREFALVPAMLPVNIDTATYNGSLNFASIPTYMDLMFQQNLYR